MDTFVKTVSGVLVAVTVGLALSKNNKDMAMLLVLTVSTMVLSVAITFLEPVFSFFTRLQALGHLNSQLLSTLIKAVGIGMLSEIVSFLCADSGNATLGKALQILATAVILWISLPLFSELLDLIEGMLQTI